MKIYCTTRGTVGDGHGYTIVDNDLIDEFVNAKLCKLSELKNINYDAYDDCIDFWQNTPDRYTDFTEDDFFVIYKDNDYLLVWEQD